MQYSVYIGLRFSRDTHTDLFDFLVESVGSHPDGSVPVRLAGEESLLVVRVCLVVPQRWLMAVG